MLSRERCSVLVRVENWHHELEGPGASRDVCRVCAVDDKSAREIAIADAGRKNSLVARSWILTTFSSSTGTEWEPLWKSWNPPSMGCFMSQHVAKDACLCCDRHLAANSPPERAVSPNTQVGECITGYLCTLLQLPFCPVLARIGGTWHNITMLVRRELQLETNVFLRLFVKPTRSTHDGNSSNPARLHVRGESGPPTQTSRPGRRPRSK